MKGTKKGAGKAFPRGAVPAAPAAPGAKVAKKTTVVAKKGVPPQFAKKR